MVQDHGLNISYCVGGIEYNVERKPGASIVSKQRICNGAFYNPHGPAVTRVDVESGVVVFEYWRGCGRGVGYVMRDALTGMIERDTRPYALRLRAGLLMVLTGYGIARLTEVLWPPAHMRREIAEHIGELLRLFLSSSHSTTRLLPAT